MNISLSVDALTPSRFSSKSNDTPSSAAPSSSSNSGVPDTAALLAASLASSTSGMPKVPLSVPIFDQEGVLVEDMGRMWLDSVVLPQLEALRTSTRYSDRIISLHMIATLLSDGLIKEDDVRCDLLLNIALTLAGDSVPNVRIALAQALHVISATIAHKQTLNPAVFLSAARVVRLLCEDADRDVRHFAVRAQEKLGIHDVETDALPISSGASSPSSALSPSSGV